MFIIIISLLLSSLIITKLLIFVFSKYNLIAEVNSRSLHNDNIPTSGGISFVFLICLLFIFFDGIDNYWLISSLFLFLFAIIGLIDDIYKIHSFFRLFYYTLIILLYLIFLDKYYLFDNIINYFNLNKIFGYFFLTVFILWFINSYNFMDGSDGFLTLHSIYVLIYLFIISSFNSNFFYDYNYLIIYSIFILCGFLFFNKPNAKIFMGDVGSIFLGFLIIIISFRMILDNLLTFWTFLILNSFFLIDTGQVLIVKILKKENIFLAHNKHFYQKLIKRYWSNSNLNIHIARSQAHKKLLFFYTKYFIFFIMPIVIIAVIFHELSFLLFLFSYILTLLIFIANKLFSE